jgi:CelD/BcsL family acetyltransferase involved in cellulose biosynthesis
VIIDQIKNSPFVTEEFLKLAVQLENQSEEVKHKDFYSTQEGTIINKGSRDFIDYRPSIELDVEIIEALHCGKVSLDSLHFFQIQEIVESFSSNSLNISKGDQVVNLVLPANYEDYLADLPRKKRHELKRKMSRFQKLYPNAELKESKSSEIFDIFVELHKTSDGAKGSFMNDKVIDFFSNLLALDGWKIYYLEVDATIIACCFVFENEKGCYLYNSSKNNTFNEVNPGIVIIDKIIQKLISDRYEFFDFLKGTERYKFDLGGTATQLYDIEVTI